MHIDSRSATGVRYRIAIAAGIAGAVLFLAACGSSDPDPAGGDDGGATSTPRFSPLDEFLNPTVSGQPAGEEEYVAQEKEIQELITTCMTAQGFDYVPFVYPITTSPAPTELDPETRDWVAKYGYGISTTDGGPTSGPTEVVDPNQAILEAMSEGEREAYGIALHGGAMGVMSAAPSTETVSTAASTETVSTDPVSTTAVPTAAAEPESPVSLPQETIDKGSMSMPALQDQGCWGQAQAEVYGDMNSGLNAPDVQAQFQSMWDAYGAMYSDLESDPRVQAATTAWLDCMAAGGHSDLKSAWDGPQQVSEKFSQLNGWDSGGAFGGDGSVMSMSAGTSAATPSAPPADELAAFREDEIALALADWDCKESAEYNTISNDVRIELETTFLQEHRTELEQYRDLMNGGG